VVSITPEQIPGVPPQCTYDILPFPISYMIMMHIFIFFLIPSMMATCLFYH
jgi:hypothetical protein